MPENAEPEIFRLNESQRLRLGPEPKSPSEIFGIDENSEIPLKTYWIARLALMGYDSIQDFIDAGIPLPERFRRGE